VEGSSGTVNWRRAYRWLFIAAILLMFSALLPWQHRKVDISAHDRLPLEFSDGPELNQVISNQENGEFDIAGYKVHKATPFGDGVLVLLAGGVITICAGYLMRQRRRIPAIGAAAASLLAFALVSYQFIYRSPPHDWSSRDWYFVWRDSHVIVQTQASDVMTLIWPVAVFLAWHSVSLLISMIREQRPTSTNGAQFSARKHGNIPL
jgi:hypothetical protein